jgi:hypothetical protein
MDESNLTFGVPWRVGVLATAGWLTLSVAEGSSTLALLAIPLLIGLWIWAVVIFDRWTRTGRNRNLW